MCQFIAAGSSAAPTTGAATPTSRFTLPEWAATARWYQIDLPRFRNGDPSNDLPETEEWTTQGPPPIIASGTPAPPPPRRHFGGDLAGVMQKFPYLKSLGVDTLYLGSVFYGATDTPPRPADMRHIDDVLAVHGAYQEAYRDRLDIDRWITTASDRMFFEFLTKAHDAGFRIVLRLDTGYRRRPGNPRINQDLTSPSYLRAVARKWSDPNGDGNPSDGVNGWVITSSSGDRDGAAEEFCTTAKEINPEALFVRRGRVAKDVEAIGFPVWKEALLSSFVNSMASTGRVASRIRKLMAPRTGQAPDVRDLPPAGVPFGFTIDRRALTQCHDSRDVNAVPDDLAYARYRLAIIFQHLLPGAPVTFCGNEVGMYGGKNDLTSSPMWWSDLEDPKTKSPHFRGDIFELVQWLYEFRVSHHALSHGSFRPMMLDENRRVLSFTRTTSGEKVVLAMNYGSSKQPVTLDVGQPGQHVVLISPPHGGSTREHRTPVSRPTAHESRLIEKDGKLHVELPPMSVKIIVVNDKEPKP